MVFNPQHANVQTVLEARREPQLRINESLCTAKFQSHKLITLFLGKKTKGDNPVNPNKPHNFLSLQEAGTQIKAQFASICKEVAGKITEMCKAEKDAWHKLDQLEDECETMYKQVETKTEVLVSYEFKYSHPQTYPRGVNFHGSLIKLLEDF